MLLRSHLPTLRPADRRGAILIVVISLLTIFAVIAITFVFYSAAEADAARIHKDSIALGDAGQPDPNEAINGFLGALIYPSGDTNSLALTNALRGHDLARGVYGWTGTAGDNLVPFNGVGTFHETTALPTSPDRARVVNHTAMNLGGTTYLYDPEWTGIRPLAASPPYPSSVPGNTVEWMPTLGSPGGRAYIAKNAPYTYPDANNLFLASISPQTGQVLVPSFYRPWQFRDPSQLATLPNATGLEPPTIPGGNPNWLQSNPQGRAFILRPRPEDNIYNGTTEFPYVPSNADGTYTGDVQNLTGGYFFDGTNFQARNDSLWMNVGLQPRKWNGKWVVPLIAPLIIDLDGRVNLSAHGNRPVGGGNAGAHTSYAGYGPWEVNPEFVLGPESAAVVNARQNNANPYTRAGIATRAYGSGNRLPSYAKVNWSGANGAAIQTPGQSSNFYSTCPFYPVASNFDDNTNTAYQLNHPSLFNPAEWPAVGGNPRTFAPSDLRWLSGKYAADREFYQQTDIAKLTAPFATPDISLIRGSPGTYIGSTYRLDPVHRNRHAVTPFGATLDVPGNMPGAVTAFPSLAGGAPPGRFFSSNAGSYAGTVSSGVPIAPLDLNRPLADYRNNTGAALSTGNAGNTANARADRQTFARDIFARLCIATGGTFTPITGGYTNGSTVTYYTAVTTVGPVTYAPGDVQILAGGGAQYDALRSLAQLAANIVDYLDADDVCTAFVWNPLNPADPLNPSNFGGANLGNRVVFGAERPRLVINEAYSEITNQWDEETMGNNMPPTRPAHVRFWVELLNPSSLIQPTPLTAPINPLGDGSVSLPTAYRIEIYRDNAMTAGTVENSLRAHDNVKGDPTVSPGVAPAARFTFTAGPNTTVSPNNGNYDTTTLVPTSGAVMVGPSIGAGAGPQPFEFNPTAGGAVAPWNTMIQSPLTTTPPAMGPQEPAMEYLLGTIPDEAALNDQTYKRHVIVLQRLANPYVGYDPATNPYITVDYMDWVPSFDAVNRTPAEMMAGRQPKGGGMLPGYDPAPSRFAVGKVQPYAGRAHATLPGTPPMYPNYAFNASPKSFVLRQNPTGYDTNSVSIPRHTFGRHNGLTTAGPGNNGLPTNANETLMSPFDMMVHLDRPLGNPLELLHVLAVKPHKITQDFVRDQPAGTLRKDLALAPWFGVTNPGVAATEVPGYDGTQTHNQLYRAFDLLRVRPWTAGAVMGGKVHGRININTVQDPRVLMGLFDPQAGNGFDANFVNTTAWAQWIGSRTPLSTVQAVDPTQPSGFGPVSVPIPGPTVDDWPGVGVDRPFKPFGVGEQTPGTLTAASGLQDTILRTAGSPAAPILWNGTQAHPIQQAEALRKILNNTTTTSGTFLVIFTIGYFEVRTDSNGNPVYAVEGHHFVSPPALPAPPPPTQEIRRWILGREAYREVPGDLRQQFMAVIDRNNIAVNPTDLNPSGRPFFTRTEATAAIGDPTITVAATDAGGTPVVYADGVPIALQTNMNLVIGLGVEQEVVQVAAIVPAGVGTYTLTLAAPLTRPHTVGSLVSNVRYGNPGPQLGSFDVTDPKNFAYRHVVPYWARVR